MTAPSVSVRAILWDFGDTLADETWMQAPMRGAPPWPAAWRALAADERGLFRRWDLGEATRAEVAQALAGALAVPAAAVAAHMEACSRKLTFFPAVMEFVDRCRLPQAIVTINSDIFSEIVVPACDLRRRFDPIVASWKEGTLSKADLCDIARTRLPGELDRGECLLIDNKAENIAEWTARGGVGHHFQNAESLAAELAARFGL